MAEAENIKLGVEQSQRDRRRQTENMQVMVMEMFVLLLGHSCKIGNMRFPGTLKNQNPHFQEKK